MVTELSPRCRELLESSGLMQLRGLCEAREEVCRLVSGAVLALYLGLAWERPFQTARRLTAELRHTTRAPRPAELDLAHRCVASCPQSLRTPGVREVPRVLVIGSRGHGKCSLITSLLSLLAGARTRPASLEMCSLRRGEALLGVNVERVLEGVGRDRQVREAIGGGARDMCEDARGAELTRGWWQPMEITVSCALDELDTEVMDDDDAVFADSALAVRCLMLTSNVVVGAEGGRGSADGADVW